MPSFDDMPEEPASLPDMGMDDMGGEPAPADDKPFDDTPLDTGVEASEDEDPKKFIQQLSGKIGTSLRSYTELNGVDLELEKFAINSLISATHTDEMDEEDRQDIINKIQNPGEGDDEDEPVDDDMNTTGASEGGDAPSNPASDMGAAPAGGGGAMGESFERKEVFADPKLGVPDDQSNFYPLQKENSFFAPERQDDDLIFSGGLVDDYTNVDDFERSEREVDYGYPTHDDYSLEEEGLIDSNTEKPLSNDKKSNRFADNEDNINFAIDRMISDYLNTQNGFQDDEAMTETEPAIAPEVKPETAPQPTTLPRRRQPYRVSPNTNPNPKANL